MAGVLPKLYTENSWKEGTCDDMGIAMYPRELTITGVDDSKSWVWHSLILGSVGKLGLEAPKLMGSTHVEIRWKVEMSKLTPGAKYQASLLAMLSDPVEGWEQCPVTFELNLPDGTRQSRQVDMSKLPKNQFVMMVLGYFEGGSSGELTFSMVETSDHVKKGLVIKDAIIRPLPKLVYA